jgi:hypothetical protein
VLSEYSSNESEKDFHSTGEVSNQNNFAYLDEMLGAGDKKSLRLFNFYNLQDEKRTRRWSKMNPKLAEEQSLKQLKRLIALNLCKPI